MVEIPGEAFSSMDGEQKDSQISDAASAMAKKRWAVLSEDERKAAMEKARAERQRKTSKARRREIASAAAMARWAKARAAKKAGQPPSEPKPSTDTRGHSKRNPKPKP
jgi:hypothetical protein